MPKIKQEAMSFDVASGKQLIEKINELQQDGWELGAITPISYCKTQVGGQDRFEVARVILTLKRMED